MYLDCNSAINFIAQNNDITVDNRQLFFKGSLVICAGLRNKGDKILLVTKINHYTIQLLQSTISDKDFREVGSLSARETCISERYEECELSYYIGHKKQSYLSIGIATNPMPWEIKSQVKDFIISTHSKSSFFSSRAIQSISKEEGEEKLEHYSLSLAKIISAKNG